MNALEDGLLRFMEAEEPVLTEFLEEPAAGTKRTHWMWFSFPQPTGPGRSAAAKHCGIDSIGEASAYRRHPVLGLRLKECTELLLRAPAQSAHEIYGPPVDLKLRSCMTLFAEVAEEEPVFNQVFERFFDGKPDARRRIAAAMTNLEMPP
jgi:uncharacterized protein (DUF1810 family)